MIEKIAPKINILLIVLLYLLISIVSVVHLIDFFGLTNNSTWSLTLAIGFEIGSLAVLTSLAILDRLSNQSKTIIWGIFIILASISILGNVYASYNYIDIENIKSFSELLGIQDEEIVYQKRLLAYISGVPIVLVVLGFIKTLIDYMKPSKEIETVVETTINTDDISNEELESLKKDVENKDSLIEDLGNYNIELENKNSLIVKDFDFYKIQMESEVENLKTQLKTSIDDFQTELSKLQKSSSKVKDKDSEIKDLRIEIKKLISDKSNELSDKQATIYKLEDDLRTLKENQIDVKVFEEQIQSIKDEYEKQIESLQKQLEVKKTKPAKNGYSPTPFINNQQ